MSTLGLGLDVERDHATRDYSEENQKQLPFLSACNSWVNFCARGQFEIRILILRLIDTAYFLRIF